MLLYHWYALSDDNCTMYVVNARWQAETRNHTMSYISVLSICRLSWRVCQKTNSGRRKKSNSHLFWRVCPPWQQLRRLLHRHQQPPLLQPFSLALALPPFLKISLALPPFLSQNLSPTSTLFQNRTISLCLCLVLFSLSKSSKFSLHPRQFSNHPPQTPILLIFFLKKSFLQTNI